jgi:hypothetical protein
LQVVIVFHKGFTLTPLCLLFQVLAWDLRAISLRRRWYSTIAKAASTVNAGRGNAAFNSRIAMSSVNPLVFF